MVKWGLGEPYENVNVLPEKVRAWADLTKPASTLGIMLAVIAGSVFFSEYTGTHVPVRDIIAVAVISAASHGASQSMNMAEDAEMDAETEHKKNRPIPSGAATKEEARAISWILMSVAISWSYLLKPVFGVFISVLALMGIFYNLSPVRAKARIISIPWQAVSRGLLFFPTIWAAYSDPFSPVPWVLGVFMFFYVLGFQNSADIIDEEADREHGVRTFVVEFGVRRVALISLGSTLLMVATITTAVNEGMLPERMFAMLLIVPFCIAMVYYMAVHPNRVSVKTGNHPSWIWFYVGLVAAVCIPMTVEIIH